MTDHSSDVSTDDMLSSPRRVGSRGNGGYERERIGEVDKQILEWAGKLEMESIDLRNKSSVITAVLKENSSKLYDILEKIHSKLETHNPTSVELPNIPRSPTNTTLTRDLDFTSIIEKLEHNLLEELKKFETKKVENLTSTRNGTGNDINDTIRKYSEICSDKIIKSNEQKQDKMTRSLEFSQGMLLSFGTQLEDIHSILTSISLDVKNLDQRQSALEDIIINKKELSFDISNDTINLHGTTLGNDESESHIADVSNTNGPITRSKSRVHKARNTSKPSAILEDKIVKKTARRDLTVARTIIPWEEIDTYYSSEL